MNKTLYDYFGAFWVIIGLFTAYSGIMPREEQYTLYRLFNILFSGILIGYGIAKFRLPLIQISEEKVIILSKDFIELAFDKIQSCTYSNTWGNILFKLNDGTVVKSHISLIRSRSQLIEIVKEINSRLSAPIL